MLNEKQKKLMEKQGYRLIGNHSAVKLCKWTKNALNNQGGCYKQHFYGIKSHQCLQMTSSLYCASNCSFCWRSKSMPVSKKWVGNVDEPKFIVDEAIKNHIKLLQGIKGSSKINKKLFSEISKINNAALSLTGEPITYPKINELLDEFHKRGISTFLVTNAQFPEQIEKIKNVTQLYISLDAPNKELLKKIDNPIFPDFYERLLKSLEIMSKKKFRTCIRLTLIKDVNDVDLNGYKELILKGNPDFVEVKGFMRLGEARQDFKWDNMPSHEYVKAFAEKLAEKLDNYEIKAEHKPSSAVLLSKKPSSC